MVSANSGGHRGIADKPPLPLLCDVTADQDLRGSPIQILSYGRQRVVF
jgi:hypothetical protein